MYCRNARAQSTHLFFQHVNWLLQLLHSIKSFQIDFDNNFQLRLGMKLLLEVTPVCYSAWACVCVCARVCHTRRDLGCIQIMTPPPSSISAPVFKEKNLIKDKADKMCYKQEHMHILFENLKTLASYYFWQPFCYIHGIGNNNNFALMWFFIIFLVKIVTFMAVASHRWLSSAKRWANKTSNGSASVYHFMMQLNSLMLLHLFFQKSHFYCSSYAFCIYSVV